VLGDLKVPWDEMKEEDVTPEFLAAKTLAQVRGQPERLETMRSLGPFFDHGCSYSLRQTRCVFWMWESEGEKLRGIELRFESDQEGRIVGTTGRYVYDTRSQRQS